jgi:hypothetical protein
VRVVLFGRLTYSVNQDINDVMEHPGRLIDGFLLFDIEDGGDTFVRNVVERLPYYTESPYCSRSSHFVVYEAVRSSDCVASSNWSVNEY